MNEDLTKGGRIRRITRWREPVMHTKTEPVTCFDESLRSLVKDMFATMNEAQGVGLAATQVGVSLAVFIFRCPDENDVVQTGVVCNPVVELPQGNQRRLESAEEGCLSWPGAYQSLARPDHAVCTGVDIDGNPIEVIGTGLLARCLQHETDHLNGVVFGDRLSGRARKKLDEQHDKLVHLYPDDWPITPKGN